MTQLEKVATSHDCNFMWVGVFVPLEEQFAENANKSYHVCKEIAVLHICHNFLVSDKQGLLKKKLKFGPYQTFSSIGHTEDNVKVLCFSSSITAFDRFLRNKHHR